MRRRQAFRCFIAAAMAAVLLLPAAAAADDLIVIPVSGVTRGEEGQVLTIATVAVSQDVVGATCQITGSTVNQVSVHDGNDLLITTGGQTFVVPDFEDAGFIVHEAGETAAIGPTVQLQIRFGPDGVSSGGFRVSVDCEPTDSATTTAPPTTVVSTTDEPTTAPPTPTSGIPSTTVPATTDSSVPTTDAPATSVDANAPTTSEEPPAGPTTEGPASTTTTTATPTTATPTTATPTTEVPPTGPSAEGEGSLPVTGSSTSLLLGLGTMIVVAGVGMRRIARL